MNVLLQLRGVRKSFNRRTIIRELDVSVAAPGSVAITGRNGSGKSTLMKLIAGVIAPTSGTIELQVEGKSIPADEWFRSIGFVAPYLNLYDEFTARENVELLQSMRGGTPPSGDRIQELFELVGLVDRQDDRLGTFSSGMKQRIKYIFALVHQPPLLLLDEPTSNLDQEGFEMVERIVTLQKSRGIVVVATNDADEARWCDGQVALQPA